MNKITDKQLGDAERQFKRFEAMICSMTPDERSNPDLLAKARWPGPGLTACCQGGAAGEGRDFSSGMAGWCPCTLPSGARRGLGQSAAMRADLRPLPSRSGSVLGSVRPCKASFYCPIAPAPACISAVRACAQSASRRRRISRGSGHREMDVTGMLGTFTQMRARMNSLSQMLKAGGAQGAPFACQPEQRVHCPVCMSAATGNVIFCQQSVYMDMSGSMRPSSSKLPWHAARGCCLRSVQVCAGCSHLCTQ